MNDKMLIMLLVGQVILAMAVFVIATAQFYILRQLLYW